MQTTLHSKRCGRELQLISAVFLLLPSLLVMTSIGGCAAHSKMGGSQPAWKAYVDNGKYADAIPLLERHVSAYPSDGAAHCQLGVCYLKTKASADSAKEKASLDSSEQHLVRASELAPSNQTIRMWLAYVRLAKGVFAQARLDIEYAAQIGPADAGWHYGMAQALYGLGEYDRALAELEPAMSEPKYLKGTYCLRAYIADSMARYEEAAQFYELADGAQIIPWCLHARNVNRPDGWYSNETGVHFPLVAAHRYYLAGNLSRAEGLAKRFWPPATFGAGLALRNEQLSFIEVSDGSPAATAGIRDGDVLVALDDTVVVNGTLAHDKLIFSPPGVPVRVRIRRAAKELTLMLTPAQRPNLALAWCEVARGNLDEALDTFKRHRSSYEPWPSGDQGVALVYARKGTTSSAATEWGLSYLGATTHYDWNCGLVFRWVWRNAPAERAGLKPGDILLTYANRPVAASSWADSRQFLREVSLTPIGIDVPISVLRNGAKLDLMVRLEPLPESVMKR